MFIMFKNIPVVCLFYIMISLYWCGAVYGVYMIGIMLIDMIGIESGCDERMVEVGWQGWAWVFSLNGFLVSVFTILILVLLGDKTLSDIRVTNLYILIGSVLASGRALGFSTSLYQNIRILPSWTEITILFYLSDK